MKIVIKAIDGTKILAQSEVECESVDDMIAAIRGMENLLAPLAKEERKKRLLTKRQKRLINNVLDRVEPIDADFEEDN